MNYIPHLNDLRNRLIAMIDYRDGMVPIPTHAEELRHILTVIVSYLLDRERARQETDKHLDTLSRDINAIRRALEANHKPPR